jgi:UDP-N-acetylmuramate--alanine ligase
VSGCDSKMTGGIAALRERGADVSTGHDPAHVEGCSALVVTSAVPSDHPEIVAARSAGIPIFKRAQALGAIVNHGTVVAIAGTHGKTTTTALTTATLAAAGLEPTGLVGGRVPAWGGNLYLGGDSLFIVEADEYDRSFLTLRPTVAVVTTLEADHLDIYGTLEGVEEAFAEFLRGVEPDGLVVACADDSGVGRLLPRLGPLANRVLTYGTSAGSMLRAEDVRSEGVRATFTVRENGVALGEAVIGLPGLHNVRNALAAVGVARHLGVEWPAIVEGLASYQGVSRRFELVGEAGGVVFVDDYAHHPTELSATLRAARSAYPDRRLVAVFQPHLYSRTRDFAEEFGGALALADVSFVTDIFAAREAPIEGVSGEMIAGHARDAGADVRYLSDRAAVTGSVAEELRSGDLCLTLGAGDLDEAARELLDTLAGEHGG